MKNTNSTIEAAFVPTRDDLINFISDTYKEIYGFRPRPDWSQLSYEQLDKWGKELSAEAIRLASGRM